MAVATVYLKDVLVKYLKGFRRTAVFAITTQCNCRCLMCDIYEKPSMFINPKDAMEVLDFLSQNKFLIVYFTGGEPTLHPNVVELVKYANDLGLVTSMTTNGTVSRDKIMKLKESGLYLLSVSIDHWDADLCEKIRQHKDIQLKQEKTIENCREVSLRTYALAFLNSYIVNSGIEKMVKYVNDQLGVALGFCYPVRSGTSAYPIGDKLTEENLSFENLRKTIETILSLKRNGSLIANLQAYIEDIVRFHEKKPPNMYCKGGEDVVFIDNLANVYPCFTKRKLFNILYDKEAKFLRNVKCNECLTTCFREPSILAQNMFNPALIREGVNSFSTRGLFI